MIVNFSVRLKLWYAVSYFKNTSALMRNAHSFISTVAAFSAAQSRAEGGVCEFSNLIIVLVGSENL